MTVDPRRAGRGKALRPILKKDILAAQSFTGSATAAAIYLNVTVQTYKKYCDIYGCYKKCTNNKGFFRKKFKGKFGLDSILAGEHPGYSRKKLKKRLIASGYLENSCGMCGYDKQRPIDGAVPLLLVYLDDNQYNLILDNLQLRCYNCCFVTTGNISEKQVTNPAEDETVKLSSGYQDKDLADKGMTPEDIERMQDELMQ